MKFFLFLETEKTKWYNCSISTTASRAYVQHTTFARSVLLSQCNEILNEFNCFKCVNKIFIALDMVFIIAGILITENHALSAGQEKMTNFNFLQWHDKYVFQTEFEEGQCWKSVLIVSN